MSIRILLVEDDEHILGTVKTFLLDVGYEVDACMNGEAALEMFYDQSYQLAILDIMLPGMNGLQLLHEIRKQQDIPILMMTALADDDHQIRAFDQEADDYVIKPFKMQILLRRVEALLRRSGALDKEIRLNKLVLWPEKYSAVYEGVNLGLTLKEFEILLLLAQKRGKVVTHETILSTIWGYDFEAYESTVHTHIKNLRAKIPESIIMTIRGVGYRLEAGQA